MAYSAKWTKERVRAYGRQRKNRRSTFLKSFKQAAGCMDCGYDVDGEAMDFDHLPQYVKLGDVSQMCMGNFKKLLEEMAVCEVVCANCHRLRTRDRRKANA